MNITRAFLRGLGVAVPIGILYWLLKPVIILLYNSWLPLIKMLIPNSSFGINVFLAFLFSFLVLVLIGYLTEFIHPLRYLKKMILRISLVRAFLGNHERITLRSLLGKKAAIIQSGGINFFSFLMGETKIGDETMFKVFVPTSPMPFTGFLIPVPPQSLKILDISPGELLSQIMTYGAPEIERIPIFNPTKDEAPSE